MKPIWSYKLYMHYMYMYITYMYNCTCTCTLHVWWYAIVTVTFYMVLVLSKILADEQHLNDAMMLCIFTAGIVTVPSYPTYIVINLHWTISFT